MIGSRWRILKYLKRTEDLHIRLGSLSKDEDVLYSYNDADWAEEMGLIGVVKSLSEACPQAVYLKGFFDYFSHTLMMLLMYEGNRACFKMLESKKIGDKTKHFENKLNFVKDLKQTERISFQLTDFSTNPLGPEKLTI
ncbi:hypothetical protein JTB14_018047 [Gonioctena quinquepunctata]|nr:hypothetical protein JTB14_018047 [Gonioctena quinquepunctata]